MSRKAQVRTLIAPFVAGLLFALGAAAHADRKVFPATFCMRYAESQLHYDIRGGATNPYHSSRWVICPILRDNTYGTALPVSLGGIITDWDVTVNRNGNNALWEIELWSMPATGTSGVRSTLTVPGTQVSTGDDDWDGDATTWAYADGFHWIRTKMPSEATIIRYAVSEK